jgi:hypothetical protein
MMFMTNLSLKIETGKTNSKLEIAFNALRKASMPKQKVSIEDYDLLESAVVVSYYDPKGNFQERLITNEALFNFINEYYNNIIDCQVNGYHEQFIDHTTPADYLAENTNEVLTDYLTKGGLS